jgi:hypothetical protein
MKRETDKQHMDRLRAVRGLPPLTRENLMDRTRAAVAYCNTRSGTEALKMQAFLSIFHPEMSDEVRRELVHAARSTERER